MCACAHTCGYPIFIPYGFVGNNVDFWHWEPIERAGYRQGVGSHIFKHDPISNRHHGQQSLFHNLVQSITSGTPDWWWNQLTEMGLCSKTLSVTCDIGRAVQRKLSWPTWRQYTTKFCLDGEGKGDGGTRERERKVSVEISESELAEY